MRKYIIIEGDTNDGDYVTERNVITDEQIEKISIAFSKLQGRTNWYTGDMVNEKRGNFSPEVMYKDILSPEEIELIDNFTPRGEYGIHSIESVDILEVANEYSLL